MKLNYLHAAHFQISLTSSNVTHNLQHFTRRQIFQLRTVSFWGWKKFMENIKKKNNKMLKVFCLKISKAINLREKVGKCSYFFFVEIKSFSEKVMLSDSAKVINIIKEMALFQKFSGDSFVNAMSVTVRNTEIHLQTKRKFKSLTTNYDRRKIFAR